MLYIFGLTHECGSLRCKASDKSAQCFKKYLRWNLAIIDMSTQSMFLYFCVSLVQLSALLLAEKDVSRLLLLGSTTSFTKWLFTYTSSNKLDC